MPLSVSEGGGLIWSLVALLLMASLAISLSRLISVLRRDHPELYEELGHPRFFWGGDSGATWKFSRFLFSKRSRLTGDSQVTRLCFVARLLYVPTLIWVGLPFLLIIWFAVVPSPGG